MNCLRGVPYEVLFDAFAPFVVTPVLDGDFLSMLPSQSFKDGKVAEVAILAGSNTDEGTATFFGPRGKLNSDADVHDFLKDMGSGLTEDTIQQIMNLYPDVAELGCPFNTGSERYAENGHQYKRGAAIVGDLAIHAGRRQTVMYYASQQGQRKKPVYSYRFDQSPWDNKEILVAVDAPVFSTHYAEVCFVFNIDPEVSRNNTNWIGPYPEYYKLSNLMSRMFVSFIHDLNPNNHGIESVAHWPEYAAGRENFVFRAEGSQHEVDTWRAPQLEYWTKIWSQLRT